MEDYSSGYFENSDIVSALLDWEVVKKLSEIPFYSGTVLGGTVERRLVKWFLFVVFVIGPGLRAFLQKILYDLAAWSGSLTAFLHLLKRILVPSDISD